MKPAESILIHLLREGQWGEAVALYRDETGTPRRHAVREVRRLAEQHQIRVVPHWSFPNLLALLPKSIHPAPRDTRERSTELQ